MSLVSFKRAFGKPWSTALHFMGAGGIVQSGYAKKEMDSCFLLKEKDRINSLLLSASDTKQFSIQILLTMIVQFGIPVESMKSNKVPFNILQTIL